MLLESIILGIIQGVTEFLPVSSSGHLALFNYFANLQREDLIFEVGVHFGSVLSIIAFYRKIVRDWAFETIKGIVQFKMNSGLRLFLLVIVSALPAGVVGVFLKDYISQAFGNLFTIGICFAITGLILFITEKKAGDEKSSFSYEDGLQQTEKIKFKHALIIGLAQAFAILPGISRSGSTIAVALLQGISRSTAAMFSFLMSIPVILGASLLQVKDLNTITGEQLEMLIVAIISSFLFGLIGLTLIVYFVKKARLDFFSRYLWGLSALCLALHFWG